VIFLSPVGNNLNEAVLNEKMKIKNHPIRSIVSELGSTADGCFFFFFLFLFFLLVYFHVSFKVEITILLIMEHGDIQFSAVVQTVWMVGNKNKLYY
jgi:hypothetical protein